MGCGRTSVVGAGGLWSASATSSEGAAAIGMAWEVLAGKSLVERIVSVEETGGDAPGQTGQNKVWQAERPGERHVRTNGL